MPPRPRIGIAYHKNLRNTTTPDTRGVPDLRDDGHKLLLPDVGPYVRLGDLVIDVAEGNGQEVGVLLHQSRKDVAPHH